MYIFKEIQLLNGEMILPLADEAEAVLNRVHHYADKNRSTLPDKNVNIHRL